MILLDKNKYYKAVNPLSKVDFNNLFARSVIEKHVDGCVFADDAKKPAVFYIVHPYGMSLLLGETENEEFNRWLIEYCLNNNDIRNKNHRLQVFPDIWNKKFSDLFADNLVKYDSASIDENDKKIIEYSRVNFEFKVERYQEFRQNYNPENFRIIRTDRELFNVMQGKVIPKYFWDNADDFNKRGIGFSLINEDKHTSTAYSAFIHDNYLEIGIETSEDFRGRGFALIACSALIDYCLNNNYVPIWSCRLDNAGSFNLAKKLGFEPIKYLPIYSLPV